MSIENINEQNFVDPIPNELPRDVLFEIALRMDKSTLRKFCQSNQRIHKICSDPYFKDTWLRYHDQLSLQQRKEIDAVLDRIVEDLIKDAGLVLLDTDLIKIKKLIREKFRTIIGRDLRHIIVRALRHFLEMQIEANVYGYYPSPILRTSVNRVLRHDGIYNVFNDIYQNFPDISTDGPNFLDIISNGISDILIINGFTDLEDFEQIVQNIPELRFYEKDWYSLFPRH